MVVVAVSFDDQCILGRWDAVDKVFRDLNDVGAWAEGEVGVMGSELRRVVGAGSGGGVPLRHEKMGSGGEEMDGGGFGN